MSECKIGLAPSGLASMSIWLSLIHIFTTVGYGDLYPSSDVGRTIAMISSLIDVSKRQG